MFAVVVLAFGAGRAFAQTPGATPARIAAVHAQLFYDETGGLSDDLLGRESLTLWNTIIGEGDAGRASNATLVTVEVHGRRLPFGAVRVIVTARNSLGRVIATRTTPVDLYDEHERFFAPLFLVDTGCDEITITARLAGAPAQTAPQTRVIPFRCGE